MKYIFLLTAILINSLELHSQCISVELSIHWASKKDLISMHNDSGTCIPYLNITYRNNSNMSRYFLKASQSLKGYPKFVGREIGKIDYSTKSTRYGKYSTSKYNITLGVSAHYLNSWEVMPDSVDYFVEHATDPINDDLEFIYRKYFNDSTDTLKKIKTNYSSSDITPSGILNRVKNKFVFLRPGEVYTDTYNLIGFKLLRGCFTFFISPKSFKKYVYTEPTWDNKKSKFINKRVTLPFQVGEYKLYSGNFYSNKVVISF